MGYEHDDELSQLRAEVEVLRQERARLDGEALALRGTVNRLWHWCQDEERCQAEPQTGRLFLLASAVAEHLEDSHPGLCRKGST